MPTDKALDILCRRQFFHQRHFPPDANHPLCHAPCCVSHSPFYCATYPPSTVMVCPVTNEAASEQSHTTASAISSDRRTPSRRKDGTPRRNCRSRGVALFRCCLVCHWAYHDRRWRLCGTIGSMWLC